MLSAIITPTGAMAGIQPTEIFVTMIAAADFAIGDLVRADLESSSTTYTVAAHMLLFGKKTCPFNVCVAAGGAINNLRENGIFGVIMAPVLAGKQAKVCIGGVCRANTTGSPVVGSTLQADTTTAKLLSTGSAGSWPSIATVLVAPSSSPGLATVLLSGFAIGSNTI